MYFCSVSKVYPEYKIMLLFMRFSFSFVLYEFTPYPLCSLKYLLQLQNKSLTNSVTVRISPHDGLIPMPLLILPAVSHTDHCLYLMVLFTVSYSERPLFLLELTIHPEKGITATNCKGSILGDLIGLEAMTDLYLSM